MGKMTQMMVKIMNVLMSVVFVQMTMVKNYKVKLIFFFHIYINIFLYQIVPPASMWTKKELQDFKDSIRKEGGDSIIKVIINFAIKLQ